ncbi:MAG: YigZ family protein [Bacteroidales bacterium]|nr:YigZ family protein [Bacteroidales bacterium]
MAFAVPVSSEEEIREKMEWLKKKYFDARHHCYAWRLGVGGAHFRTYDDGEPAGSAGKPILRQITSFGLTNILVAVVRYFGGIPLGTAGLVQAYKHASIDALSHANIVPAVLTDTFLLTFDYQNMDQVLRTLKDMELEYTDRCFENNCSLKVKVRQSLSGVLLHRIGRIASAEMQA